jgi:hypothetical protein
MITTVIQKTTAAAEVDRQVYQKIIEAQEVGDTLTAATANLGLCAALVVPNARLAEFNAATESDKVRFVLVSQRTFQRTTESGDFVAVFEDEYLKEFS